MAMTAPLLLLLALAGCGRPSTQPEATQAAAGPSLVLVTMDTTRADFIGAYGAEHPTPTVDGLAAQGARFTRAYATVPLTTPSHSSMLTGLYPTRHGVHTNGDAVLSESATTLAEVLKAHGYHTGASVSAFVTTRIWNLDQGFDAYFDQVNNPSQVGNKWTQERPANEVVDDALAWLGEQDAATPYFLWVHLYDPHHPYAPPPEWKQKLPGRPYAAEIGFMDEQIGRLKQGIDARQQKGGTAWVAIADHGEALGSEHGESTHGVFVFEPTVHIPFIIRPAQPLDKPAVIDGLAVSGVDVMPTALGLLGIKPPDDLDGVDLSSATRGETPTRPGVYVEAYTTTQRFGYAPEIAAIEGNLKLMDTPSPRLYDVVADPKEQNNLYADRPADAAHLHTITEAVQARAVTSEAAAMSPEVIEQLAALGYMGAGNSFDPSHHSDIDAKDRLDTISALEEARKAAREPDGMARAEATYREILAREPQISEARLGLSRILDQQGRLPEAETVLRDALKLEPGSTALHTALGQVLSRQQRWDDSLLEYEAALALVPGDDGARGGVIRALTRLDRESEALDRAQAWLAENPANLNMQAFVGVLLLGTGEVEDARKLLLASSADGVARERVYECLSRIATNDGDIPLATDYLQREIDAYPGNPNARTVLANMYMSQHRFEDAAAEYSFVAENMPEKPDSRRMWAQAVFNSGDYELARDVLAPALKEWPNNPDVLLLQANILGKLGDTEGGQKLFEKAKALNDARKATNSGRGRRSGG